MKESHSGYLKFLKKDRARFLSEMSKLSKRAKNLLENADMQTWDGFYYHLFVNQDLKDFTDLRNSGIKSQKELVAFMRKILDPHGHYNKVIERFDDKFSGLSGHAQKILKINGISLFETFCYRLIIKREVIDLSKDRRAGKVSLPEAENFVETICGYLGTSVPRQKNKIYFNPNNPSMPFTPKMGIKKTFSSEFENLSKSTKDFLLHIGANNIDGFYTSFISPDSPFNTIFNDIGESNLLEILKFRSILKGKIKTQIK